MAELPKLPESAGRLLDLRWRELVRQRGFTGEHLTWHDSPERRRNVARPKVSLAPPPRTRLHDPFSRPPTIYKDAHGKPVSYEVWRERQLSEWAARAESPENIDSIGIGETVALAEATFKIFAEAYISLWADTNGDSDTFGHWLATLAHSVVLRIKTLWRQPERHRRWFERACQSKVEDALAAHVEAWAAHAARLEISHLENPNLSLSALLTAQGPIKLSVQVVANTRRLSNEHQTGALGVIRPDATHPVDIARDECDFTSEFSRNNAISCYTRRHGKSGEPCSEADLARAAIVNRSDLSKWKKGTLPSGSAKTERIEQALLKNAPPVKPKKPGRQR